MKPAHRKLLARLVGLYDRETIAREAMTVELPKRGNRQARGRPVLSEDVEGWAFNSMLIAVAIDEWIEIAKGRGYAAPAEYAYASYLNFDPTTEDYDEQEAYIKAREALERRVAKGRALLREHGDDPEFKALVNWMRTHEAPPMEAPVKFDPSKLRKKST